MLILIFPLEILSNFVLRPLSLTIRLWANLLAGHLLIDFMAGNLAVLLGLQLLGWFTLPLGVVIFLFEAVLIAGLQAFIFAILTAIYLGGAAEATKHPTRRTMLTHLIPFMSIHLGTPLLAVAEAEVAKEVGGTPVNRSPSASAPAVAPRAPARASACCSAR